MINDCDKRMKNEDKGQWVMYGTTYQLKITCFLHHLPPLNCIHSQDHHICYSLHHTFLAFLTFQSPQNHYILLHQKSCSFQMNYQMNCMTVLLLHKALYKITRAKIEFTLSNISKKYLRGGTGGPIGRDTFCAAENPFNWGPCVEKILEESAIKNGLRKLFASALVHELLSVSMFFFYSNVL